MINQVGIQHFITTCLNLIRSEQNLPPLGRVTVLFVPNSDYVQVHVIWDSTHQSTISVEIPGIVTSKAHIKLGDHTTKIVEDLKKAIFDQQFAQQLEGILDTEDENK